MKAYLYGDHMVEIDPRAADMGGSFQGRRPDGTPAAWDEDVIARFDRDVINTLLPDDLFIDVGASTGGFTLLLTLHPDLKSWAFEPYPYAEEVLRSNLKLNGLAERVTVWKCALGSVEGSGILNIPGGNQSGLACLGNPQRFVAESKIQVLVCRLDNLVIFERIGAIKLDTEGMEYYVLLGGETVIKRDRPSILLEIWPPNAAQFGLKGTEALDLLKQWGMRCEQIGSEDWLARWI